MDITILLFDRFTALDAVGPYEVLSRLPGATVSFVARERGIVRTDVGSLGIEVATTIAEVDRTDLLLVPGGPGETPEREVGETIEWVRAIDATTTWTTSVCTGALVLAQAGLLAGRRATTHWGALHVLERLGAIPVEERWVESDKYVTAAGVSAGIDMALALTARIAGDDLAQMVQLGIEYDPAPPFVGGSTRSAPAHIRAALEPGLRYAD
jgi:transcriptional regulator GlxA family with amidase domain